MENQSNVSIVDNLGEPQSKMIEEGLEGMEVEQFKSGIISARSYLTAYVKAVEFVDLIGRKPDKHGLTIDGVLFFRAREGNNRVMMRVTASIGKQKLVCFKSGTHMMDLVGMFCFKLERDEIDWRIERETEARDDTKGYPGGLSQLPHE